jgi:hypothetical protein
MLTILKHIGHDTTLQKTMGPESCAVFVLTCVLAGKIPAAPECRSPGPVCLDLRIGPGSRASVSRSTRYTLNLSSRQAVFTFHEGFGNVDDWYRDEATSLAFEGASEASVSGRHRDDFEGAAEVRLSGLFPEVDLICEVSGRAIEYRFLAGSETNAHRIRLKLDGIGRFRLRGDGVAEIRTAAFPILLHPPVDRNAAARGEPTPLAGRFVLLENNRLVFRLAEPRSR